MVLYTYLYILGEFFNMRFQIIGQLSYGSIAVSEEM